MKTKILLLLIVCLPLLVHTQNSGNSTRGKYKVETMTSEILGVERNYSIYTPKSYGTHPDKKYPVLYLFHGIFGDNNNWLRHGHLYDKVNQIINADEAVEMIIVMPDASTEWNGYFDMDGWSYESYFFEELIPHIEENYRVIQDKNHRAVAGFSMGGGGATAYAIKHPEMFSSVYAVSALMTVPDKNLMGKRLDNFKGREHGKAVKLNDCSDLILNSDESTKEKLRTIRWFIDCGDDDYFLDMNMNFIKELNKANISYQFRVRDGGHGWEYWRSSVNIFIPFVSNGFKR